MDSDAVKLILESQERTFRSTMDIVVKQLYEKIKSVESTTADLTRSLEFSQADLIELQNEVRELRKSNDYKQVIIEELQSRTSELEQRVNYQEDYSRRNNLRITGLQEQP